MMNHIQDTNKIWYVYILECNDSTLYTGITTDLNRRLNEHNTSDKGAKYTKYKRPVSLVYFEILSNRSDATKRECSIKKLSKQNKILLFTDFKVDLNKNLLK